MVGFVAAAAVETMRTGSFYVGKERRREHCLVTSTQVPTSNFVKADTVSKTCFSVEFSEENSCASFPSNKYSNHLIYCLLVSWSNFLSHLNSHPGDLPTMTIMNETSHASEIPIEHQISPTQTLWSKYFDAVTETYLKEGLLQLVITSSVIWMFQDLYELPGSRQFSIFLCSLRLPSDVGYLQMILWVPIIIG